MIPHSYNYKRSMFICTTESSCKNSHHSEPWHEFSLGVKDHCAGSVMLKKSISAPKSLSFYYYNHKWVFLFCFCKFSTQNLGSLRSTVTNEVFRFWNISLPLLPLLLNHRRFLSLYKEKFEVGIYKQTCLMFVGC